MTKKLLFSLLFFLPCVSYSALRTNRLDIDGTSFYFGVDGMFTSSFYVDRGSITSSLTVNNPSNPATPYFGLNLNAYGRTYGGGIRTNVLGYSFSEPQDLLVAYQCVFGNCSRKSSISWTDSGSVADSAGLVVGDTDFLGNFYKNVAFPNTPSGNGAMTIPSAYRLKFLDAASNNYVSLRASTTLTSNYEFVLPNSTGTTGQVITTDGLGNWYWATPSSSGGGMEPGATYYIQNTNTLQSGATFYVSRGRVDGSLDTGYLNVNSSATIKEQLSIQGSPVGGQILELMGYDLNHLDFTPVGVGSNNQWEVGSEGSGTDRLITFLYGIAAGNSSNPVPFGISSYINTIGGFAGTFTNEAVASAGGVKIITENDESGSSSLLVQSNAGTKTAFDVRQNGDIFTTNRFSASSSSMTVYPILYGTTVQATVFRANDNAPANFGTDNDTSIKYVPATNTLLFKSTNTAESSVGSMKFDSTLDLTSNVTNNTGMVFASSINATGQYPNLIEGVLFDIDMSLGSGGNFSGSNNPKHYGVHYDIDMKGTGTYLLFVMESIPVYYDIYMTGSMGTLGGLNVYVFKNYLNLDTATFSGSAQPIIVNTEVDVGSTTVTQLIMQRQDLELRGSSSAGTIWMNEIKLDLGNATSITGSGAALVGTYIYWNDPELDSRLTSAGVEIYGHYTNISRGTGTIVGYYANVASTQTTNEYAFRSTNGDWWVGSDSANIYLGGGIKRSLIGYDGSSLNIKANNYTSTDTIDLQSDTEITGYTRLYNRTLAQIRAITPGASGQGKQYNCSDCTVTPVCISTGTTAASFSGLASKTTVCQ